jgi:hypothetical protein
MSADSHSRLHERRADADNELTEPPSVSPRSVR